MSAELVEAHLRRFLLIVAAFICAGTIVELFLAEHTEELIQLLPFLLCTLGIIAVVAVLVKPQPSTLWALRIVMTLAAAGSLLGVYEHLSANFSFEMEIRAGITASEAFFAALYGASPLLAPGILALAALLAIAATYAHPAFGNRQL